MLDKGLSMQFLDTKQLIGFASRSFKVHLPLGSITIATLNNIKIIWVQKRSINEETLTFATFQSGLRTNFAINRY